MADPLMTPAAKDDWAHLLDRIDASIARALKDTSAREKALKAAVNPPEKGSSGLTEDRLAGLRIRLDSAGRLADAVEALLAADEAEARNWVGLAERTRARLAAPPVVGI
jgi:hypothetical protein